MEKLITDFSLGLFFWQTLLFIVLVVFLKRYAWSPILSAVEKREEGIKKALASAEKARAEMNELTTNNEKILSKAKSERDVILKEAREMKNNIISQAKEQADLEAEKLVNTAKEQITNEKLKALTELKNHIADLSIEMAEKVLRSELTEPKKQKDFINKALKESKS